MKMPVKMQEKEMPTRDKRDYQVYYDYRKRTSGGFADALILSTVMLTGVMWIMLVIAVNK